jgi:hypothetical protein
VNRASAPANVLLVTTGDKFLELALALLPSVTLYKVAPADYKPSETINGAQVDLTVFDAGTPASLLKNLPPGNIMLVAPEASSDIITVTGVISAPVPSISATEDASASQTDANQGSRDPLLRFVELAPLHVAKAVHLEIPRWGRQVLSSDKGPLIVAGEEGQRKLAVLAFDLHDTDLPLQTAFPLLMRNIITYLLPDPAGGLPAEIAPGTSVGIDASSPDVDRIAVEDPSAKERTYALDKGRGRVAYAETGEPGVYYVSYYAGEQLIGQEAFAVNLFLKDESMIGPNPTPGLPRGAAPASSNVEGGFRRELWPVVALAGFALLTLEWAYAQRMAVRRALTEWRTRRAVSRADRV